MDLYGNLPPPKASDAASSGGWAPTSVLAELKHAAAAASTTATATATAAATATPTHKSAAAVTSAPAAAAPAEPPKAKPAASGMIFKPAQLTRKPAAAPNAALAKTFSNTTDSAVPAATGSSPSVSASKPTSPPPAAAPAPAPAPAPVSAVPPPAQVVQVTVKRVALSATHGGSHSGNAVVSSEPNTLHTFPIIEDEYDPFRPNDYEGEMKRRQDEERAAERQRDMEREMEEMERKRRRLREEREQEALQAVYANTASVSASSAPAPPPPAPVSSGRGRGVVNLPAWMTKGPVPGVGQKAEASEPAPGQFDNAPGPTMPPAPAGGKSMSVAEKLMAKMGYQAGQGLGKHEHGMTSAVEHEKSGSGRGVLVGQQLGVTRVLLLRNMVALADVDPGLAEETRGECTKYGRVHTVRVHTTPGAPAEDAVRIFVQFVSEDSAAEAQRDLDGRFFAGRKVSASFYPEHKFDRGDLAP